MERPSKTRLSLAPTVFTYTAGTPADLPIEESRERRTRIFPGSKGEAEGQRMRVAPAFRKSATGSTGYRVPGAGSVSHHRSSQMAMPRLEPPRLVEHVVGGKEGLGLGVEDLSVRDQGRRVQERLARAGPVPVHVPHHDADPRGSPVLHAAQRAQVPLHEGILLQQVHRRVSAEAQLGEHREVAAGIPGRARVGDHPVRVPLEVPDGGIDLAASDLHVTLPARCGSILRTGPEGQRGPAKAPKVDSGSIMHPEIVRRRNP
jgi:hypothetical protein